MIIEGRTITTLAELQEFCAAAVAATDRDAFDALAASWLLWTRWAGLEPIETLQRGTQR
jgi:hypothetical protein